EAQVVWRPRATYATGGLWRPMEAYEHLCGRGGKAFPGPDVERDAGPAPGVDVEAQGDERLDGGVFGDPRLVPITGELAPHHGVGWQRWDGAQDLGLLVADVFVAVPGRGLHSQQGDHLEHMILHDVADGPCVIVEASTAFHSKALSHGDLDRRHVGAFPDGLEESVGAAEVEQAQDRLLAEVMVDAKDRALGKDTVQSRV